MNQESLQSTVEGMLAIPMIIGVKIQNINGGNVAVGGIISQNGDVGLHVNLLTLNQEEASIYVDETYNYDIFMHKFPIVYSYEKGTKNLGLATIYSGATVVFQRVKLGFMLLVINAVIKTTALWFIFLWISNYLLRKPLTSLAIATENISLENLGSFRIKIKTSGRNELKILEESFNSMIENLHQSIVKRAQAEESLREREESFRAIFERSTIGKSLTTPHGKLFKVNQAFCDLLGYSIEEMLQHDFADITHVDDIAKSRECVRCLLANEQNTYRMEKRYTHKNGKVVWTDVSTTLLRDKDGTPLYFITSITDITERKGHRNK